MKKIEYDPKNLLRRTRVSKVYYGRLTYRDAVHEVVVKNVRLGDMFHNEAGIHASLEHPNIVDMLHADPEKRQIVSAYVPGLSVENIIKQSGPIALEDTVDILHDVISALEYMHDRNTGAFVHFDFKPANIVLDFKNMTDQRPRAYLIDFGISYALGSVPQFIQEFLVGTAGFIAPERVADKFELGQKDDMYGFGATAYQMTTGSMPYDRLDELGMMKAMLNGQTVRRIHTRSKAFNDLVMACLDLDHNGRPTAREARETLTRIRARF